MSNLYSKLYSIAPPLSKYKYGVVSCCFSMNTKAHWTDWNCWLNIIRLVESNKTDPLPRQEEHLHQIYIPNPDCKV